MGAISIDDILGQVTKPGRYLGQEWNAVKKDPNLVALKVALCFPDIYEVGMSHLGFKILYSLLNSRQDILCERVFATWLDMEKLMRSKSIPLFSLESRLALKEFDIVGFSLQYEMNYTNVLNMLDLAGIPLKGQGRTPQDPLVIAGGPCAFNPEPIADFFDVFLMGDGEEALLEIADLCKLQINPSPHLRGRERFKISKERLLRSLAQVEGVYVPSLYHVEYNSDDTIKSFRPKETQVPVAIKKRIVQDLDKAHYPTKQIVPYVQTIHDRISLEVMRGCPRRCNFCQATSIYFPRRERSLPEILRLAESTYSQTGHDEISLVSLSTGDHSQILEIMEDLTKCFKSRGVAVSLPSLRVENVVSQLPKLISSIKKTGLTFAPEAGSERLRKLINKDLDMEQLQLCVAKAAKAGWRRVKLYFMIGLPTETDQDLDSIVDLIYQVSRPNKERPPVSVTASIASFVPKPQTPFQWEPMADISTLKTKQHHIRDRLRSKNIKLNFHDVNLSFLEGVISRGDRRLGPVILKAWEWGAKFDSWRESFNFELWTKAFQDCQIDPAFYLARKRDLQEVLPWDHIDFGISKEGLWSQKQRALSSPE